MAWPDAFAAFAFWLGRLVACIYRFGWVLLEPWASNQPQLVQVGLLIVGLIVIVMSAAAAQKIDQPMLRFLEGYWPRWMKPLRRKLTQRYVNQWQQQQRQWGALYGKGEAALSAEELNEYAQFDWQLMHSPSQPNQFMPTRLGNLLRASEYRSKERYGLDAAVCWPRLWLLLPDSTRKELQEARAALNTAVRIGFWSLLFLVWTPLAWWAPLLALSGARFSYLMALSVAVVYVDLLEATFDVHRHLLYQSLRRNPPVNPAKETQEGEALNQYLWRGPDPNRPDFYDPLNL